MSQLKIWHAAVLAGLVSVVGCAQVPTMSSMHASAPQVAKQANHRTIQQLPWWLTGGNSASSATNTGVVNQGSGNVTQGNNVNAPFSNNFGGYSQSNTGYGGANTSVNANSGAQATGGNPWWWWNTGGSSASAATNTGVSNTNSGNVTQGNNVNAPFSNNFGGYSQSNTGYGGANTNINANSGASAS